MTYSLEEVSRIIRGSTYSLDNEIVERINDCLNGIAESFNSTSSRGHSGSKSVSLRSRPTYAWKVLDSDTESKLIATIQSKINKVAAANEEKIIGDIVTLLEDKSNDTYNRVIDCIFENVYGLLDLALISRILGKIVSLRLEVGEYVDKKSREWLSMVQGLSNLQCFDPEDEKNQYCEQEKKKVKTRKYCEFISLAVKNNVVSPRVIWDYTDTVIANVIKHREDYEMKEFNSFRVSCLCCIATVLIDSDAGGATRLNSKFRELLEKETEERMLYGYTVIKLVEYFETISKKNPVSKVDEVKSDTKPDENTAKPIAWTGQTRSFSSSSPASPADTSGESPTNARRQHRTTDSDWQPVSRKGGKKKNDGKIGSGLWRKG
jgi:hypothetical protein